MESLAIFHPAALATIRQHISSLVPDELHSFSPLKSFRRIVCSFYSIEAAVKVKQELDGTTFLGANSRIGVQGDEEGQHKIEAADHDIRARIYFGEPTPVDNAKQYLDKPDAGKLFFISPPPSPPVGWVSTREGAPNTETHATDLQSALEQLGSKIRNGSLDDTTDGRPTDLEVQVNNAATNNDAEPMSAVSAVSRSGTRTRSGSQAMIYDPSEHATNKAKSLPAVMLEDTSCTEEEEEGGPKLDDGTKIIAHTSRPPVELMEE